MSAKLFLEAVKARPTTRPVVGTGTSIVTEDLMDLVEHIKYALINNRTNATWQSIFGIETEYPPPEVKEQIQFANINFEVLYDG